VDRRFLLFFVIAFAILSVNAYIVRLVNPPPPHADADANADGADPNQPEGDKPKDPANDEPAGDQPAEPAGDDEKRPPEIAAQDPQSQEWLTLGSADPDPESNPYRMLVTLTNQGAAIERLELSSGGYENTDDRSGYLGHLNPVDAPKGEGALVQVVGPGTPAAEAGIEPGDVITAIADREIVSAENLHGVLEQLKPGREVEVKIRRDGEEETLVASLGRRPLQLMRPEVENLLLREEEPDDEFEDPASLLLTLSRIEDRKLDEDDRELEGIDLIDGNWEIVEHDREHAKFRRVLVDQQLEVTKTYRLDEVPSDHKGERDFPAYDLRFTVEFKNLAGEDATVGYRLDGPTGMTLEGWWYGSKIGRSLFGGAGVRDIVVRFFGNDSELFSASKVAKDDVDPMSEGSLMYVGIDHQYFAAVLIPQKPEGNPEEEWFTETRAIWVGDEADRTDNKRYTNVTFRLESQPKVLAAGEGFEHEFVLFAGPKKPELLATYTQPAAPDISLDDLNYYGWFGWITKPMLEILHFFYGWVHNYGIAIIMLTVLVRGCMFPLSRKQARNMLKMQELKPEIDRIAKQYKNEPEKRIKAQQDLFRKHNYNPMGGCLLMFVQLPIFIGLYRGLMVDVELRQAPLFSDAIRWCSNLAAPDMLLRWDGIPPFSFLPFLFGPEGFLGPYLNVLPIVTVALFLAQQKMFMPPPADEQAAMQQKVMKFMMVFIGIMFYRVASGLCLYFIASTCWGLAERKLLPKTKAIGGTDAENAATPAKTAPAKASSNGSAAAKKRRKKQKQRKR